MWYVIHKKKWFLERLSVGTHFKKNNYVVHQYFSYIKLFEDNIYLFNVFMSLRINKN